MWTRPLIPPTQALHLLAVKTRAVSVWDNGPLSSNIMMVYGVLVVLGIMLFIVYVPGVRAQMPRGFAPPISISTKP